MKLGKTITVAIKPFEWSAPDGCLLNSERAVEEYGGAVVSGWDVERMPGGLVAELTHHFIWRNTDGVLIDVTPACLHSGDECVMLDNKTIEFLPDPEAKALGEKPNRRVLPTRYVSLTQSAAVEKACKWLAVSSDELWSGDYDRAAYYNERATKLLGRLLGGRLTVGMPDRAYMARHKEAYKPV